MDAQAALGGSQKPHETGDYLGHVGDEKAPAIDGRGKLAERLEVEFGPFRSASRMAECFLVALPPVLGSSAPKFAPFEPSPTSAAAYLLSSVLLLEDCLGAPNSGWRRGPQFFQHLVELALDLVQGRAGRPKNNGVLEE